MCDWSHGQLTIAHILVDCITFTNTRLHNGMDNKNNGAWLDDSDRRNGYFKGRQFIL